MSQHTIRMWMARPDPPDEGPVTIGWQCTCGDQDQHTTARWQPAHQRACTTAILHTKIWGGTIQ